MQSKRLEVGEREHVDQDRWSIEVSEMGEDRDKMVDGEQSEKGWARECSLWGGKVLWVNVIPFIRPTR